MTEQNYKTISGDNSYLISVGLCSYIKCVRCRDTVCYAGIYELDTLCCDDCQAIYDMIDYE